MESEYERTLTWIVHDAVLDPDRGNDRTAVTAAVGAVAPGDAVTFVSGRPNGDTFRETARKNAEDGGVLLLPTSWLKALARRTGTRPGALPGALFEDDLVAASAFAPHLGHLWLNRGAVWLPWGTFAADGPPAVTAPPGGKVFVRGDDGFKTLPGETFPADADSPEFSERVRTAENLSGVRPETMILVAPGLEIDAEWRVWVIDGRPVAASGYAPLEAPPEETPADVMRTARDAADSLDETACGLDMVVDVARTRGTDRPLAVEINAITSAGLYGVDVHTLLPAVRERLTSTGRDLPLSTRSSPRE